MSEKWVNHWLSFCQEQNLKKDKGISYSQFYNWSKCPHLHWLISIEKAIPYDDNQYIILGDAVHHVLGDFFLRKALGLKKDNKFYDNLFFERLLLSESLEGVEFDLPDFSLMVNNSLNFVRDIEAFMSDKFGNYEVVDVEEKLWEDIDYESDSRNYKFHGYIDLILRDKKGKYHLIDFKTSKKGWNRWQCSDKSKFYQLVLYKHFWCEKHQIDIDDVDVHYIFLRTMGKRKFISDFDITSGKKRIENSLKELRKMIWNAYERGCYIKNVDCKFCTCKEFYRELNEEDQEKEEEIK